MTNSDARLSAESAAQLLPCPFCGGEANHYENWVDHERKWSVCCGDCTANLDVCEDTKPEATMRWNSRTGAPAQPVAWRVLNDFGHWYITQDKAIADTYRDFEKKDVQPLYLAAQPPAAPVETDAEIEALERTVEGASKTCNSYLERALKAEAKLAAHNGCSAGSDPLNGLDERLDRLLLTSDDDNRFVLSIESARNIVGIVREWIRPTNEPQPVGTKR